MATTLKSNTLPAFVLEVAEALRAKEAALTPAQTRVSIDYGDSGTTPRLVTIAATLPVTLSRVAGDAGTKFLYTDYAPDTVTLTGTPLASMAVESLAEALGVAAEDLDIAERAKIATGATIPTGVGTDVSYANLEASITCTLSYSMSIDANGRPTPVVSNHVA